MEQTDTQSETPQPTAQKEITDLTNKFEEPQVFEPIKDFVTFWSRLDSLLINLEESETNKKTTEEFHSFINQPERVSISSDSDISVAQSQFGIQEESYNSFKVAIKRPFLNVKSIQLLRASIPNAVTNIPDNQSIFWYYRLPFCYSGTITITARYTSAIFNTDGVIAGSTDTIDFNLGTINDVNGLFIGNFNVASASLNTVANIYNYATSPGYIGLIVVDAGSQIIQQPSTKNLYMNRLLPSYYKEELFDYSTYKQAQNPLSTYGFNRTFTSYQDVLSELTNCSLRDPAYDTNKAAIDLSGAVLMRNLFIPGDITFDFNEQINKFRMTGNNIYVKPVGSFINLLVRRYLIAGYNDANIPIKAAQLKLLTAGISGITPSLDFPSVAGASMGGMPYMLYKTLNMRLGFVWDGNNTSVIVVPDITTNSVTRSLLNRLRPIMSDTITSPTPPALLGAITSPQFSRVYTADAYADLVYTGSVSLYADFVGGATYDSITNTQLLACIPMSSSNLGVSFYNTTLYCPLTKISDQIYEIEIRMLTDTGAPYNIPNSAIVSLELALTY